MILQAVIALAVSVGVTAAVIDAVVPQAQADGHQIAVTTTAQTLDSEAMLLAYIDGQGAAGTAPNGTTYAMEAAADLPTNSQVTVTPTGLGSYTVSDGQGNVCWTPSAAIYSIGTFADGAC